MTNRIMEWERIEIRNQIKDSLVEALKDAQEGDKQSLKTRLEYIHNELGKGYTVSNTLKHHKSFTIGREVYTDDDKLLVIHEGDKMLMALYKCRIKKKVFIHYKEYDFMTKAERKRLCEAGIWLDTREFALQPA